MVLPWKQEEGLSVFFSFLYLHLHYIPVNGYIYKEKTTRKTRILLLGHALLKRYLDVDND